MAVKYENSLLAILSYQSNLLLHTEVEMDTTTDSIRVFWLALMLATTLFLSSCGRGGSDDPPGPGPGPDPGPGGTPGVALQINFARDDFWAFYWFNDTASFAQGSGTTSTTDFGIFRVTLGDAVNIGGLTAYPITMTGDAGPYLPRWTHVAIDADGSLLGSTDGITFSIVFDATTGQWNGGGFLYDFGTNSVDIGNATFNGEYNSFSAIEVGFADSDGGCEVILGITLCNETTTTFSFNEFFKEGIGPVGFRRDTFFSSSGGGFFTSTTIKNTVELIETNKTALDATVFNRPDWEEVAPLAIGRDNHGAAVLNGKI